MRRIAIVGGGIAGLAAALHVADARAGGADVEPLLLEAGDRLGGTIATERSGGFTIEAGADSFITEKPWALDLCRRLGIEDRLIGTQPGERRTYVVRRGRLAPVPEGFLLLAPTDLWRLAASPLFSWPAKLRMALDLVLPRGADADESIASFIRRRLGREALERVAQPLVGGIYTGDAERLSLAATLPRFRELERRHRSIILGLRAGARPTPETGGARYDLFMSHVEGMGGLVADLARRLPEGAVRLRSRVDAIRRDDRAWRLEVGGESLVADGLIVATPAYVAARLLAPLDGDLARALDAIEYASSATVTLGWPTAEFPAGLSGFGFVVPAVEGRAILAATYASRKYAGRAPEGHELVRAFFGGVLQPELVELDDAALVARAQVDLRDLLGVVAPPSLIRVHRHRRAMPQYTVGHLERVAAIEVRSATLPRLVLAGAAYHGVGIPDCVRSGETAAGRLV